MKALNENSVAYTLFDFNNVRVLCGVVCFELGVVLNWGKVRVFVLLCF